MPPYSSTTVFVSDDQPALQVVHLEGTPTGQTSWAESLPGRSLVFCFNREGQAALLGPGLRLFLHPASLSLFHVDDPGGITATRIASDRPHSTVLVAIPVERLPEFFRADQEHLHPQLRRLLESGGQSPRSFGVVRPMWLAEKTLASSLLRPPVMAPARPLWYRAKVAELLALHLFSAPSPEKEAFCLQQKRRSNSYIETALARLRATYTEDLDLEALATAAGCSPAYLSRSVKKETGHTLSQHLRAFRIEAAARLLADSRLSVTEIAYEVGYSSLSHFAKAFRIEKGVLPSQFQ